MTTASCCTLSSRSVSWSNERPTRLQLDGHGETERPIHRTTAANLSGRIENGGALVFHAAAPDDRGGNVAVVVRATWQTPPRSLPKGVRAFPITALTMPCAGALRFAPSERVLDAARTPEDFDCEPESPIDDDHLKRVIENHVAPDCWEDTANMWTIGDVLMVQADDDTLDAVHELIANLERQLLQTTELRYVNGSGRIVVPGLVDRDHALRHGVETLGIECRTESAGKHSRRLATRTVRLFEGVELASQPFATERGVGARLSWLSRCLDAEPTGHTLPPVRVAAREHTGPVPSNGLEVFDGPLGRERVQVSLLR